MLIHYWWHKFISSVVENITWKKNGIFITHRCQIYFRKYYERLVYKTQAAKLCNVHEIQLYWSWEWGTTIIFFSETHSVGGANLPYLSVRAESTVVSTVGSGDDPDINVNLKTCKLWNLQKFIYLYSSVNAVVKQESRITIWVSVN